MFQVFFQRLYFMFWALLRGKHALSFETKSVDFVREQWTVWAKRFFEKWTSYYDVFISKKNAVWAKTFFKKMIDF